jgi:hypothetical protein
LVFESIVGITIGDWRICGEALGFVGFIRVLRLPMKNARKVSSSGELGTFFADSSDSV